MMSLLIVKLTVTYYQEQTCGFVAKSVSISRTLLCFNIHIQYIAVRCFPVFTITVEFSSAPAIQICSLNVIAQHRFNTK